MCFYFICVFISFLKHDEAAREGRIERDLAYLNEEAFERQQPRRGLHVYELWDAYGSPEILVPCRPKLGFQGRCWCPAVNLQLDRRSWCPTDLNLGFKEGVGALQSICSLPQHGASTAKKWATCIRALGWLWPTWDFDNLIFLIQHIFLVAFPVRVTCG